jgi:hemerythrin-like domain-containing protein
MNTDEFLAAMNTVEKDHQLVLDKVQALRETVADVFDPANVDAQRVVNRFRDINNYFATQFTAHMEEEEMTLFPFLEEYKPGGRELVARLRQEHAEILRKREEFGNCVEFAAELEDGITRMVLRDLLAYGWELWEHLDRHAHTETRAVHECLAECFVEQGAAK